MRERFLSVIEPLPRLWIVLLALCLMNGSAFSEVATSNHNLSVSGPGTVKAQDETRICIFCHTPHNASSVAQLWNRNDTAAAHTPYSSTTMDALPGQPTGASRLCLGCHDGTVALGEVLSEAAAITMSGGITVMPAVDANLGTDLHDDHPISFVYDPDLALQDGQLADPGTLTGEVKLDAGGELQCTSCHDPHDDTNTFFLVLPATDAALCEACHERDQWETASHNDAAKSLISSLNKDIPSANDCVNCHDPHGGSGSARLLYFALEEDGCLVCHNSADPDRDIESELTKFSTHPVDLNFDVHDPTEVLPVATAHVECVDCHNPHAARTEATAAPDVSGPLAGVTGLDTDGAALTLAVSEYEVCYKCHADSPGEPAPVTPRDLVQGNTRLEFDTGNPSFHPVEGAGASLDVPSLLSPWTTASVIRCTDCHTSDDGSAAGGSGPDGPHGSDYPNLLGWNFETGTGTIDSDSTYELCYRCHDRGSIFDNVTFPYHRRHVVSARISCNICHDPHGISSDQGDAVNHSRLINFDTSYALPEQNTGLMEFQDLGDRHGTCYMDCHGKNHEDENY